MAPIADRALHDLVCRDPARGWEHFINAHTGTIVGLIERAGVRDPDETMDVYTRLCERLVEDRCVRLRRWDPDKGRLAAWLAVVVRRVVVDWVRERAGRRRLFGAVEALDPLARQAFELFYWHDRTPAEIASVLTTQLGRPVSLLEVLGALDAVHAALTARQFAELASMAVRSRAPLSLDAEVEERGFDPADPLAGPDVVAGARQQTAQLDSALAALPTEDAAIVRLHYGQGLPLSDVQRALHARPVTRERVRTIIDALRRALSGPATGATAVRISTDGGSRA